MVRDALKVAPPALAHIILKHPDSFREGLSEANLSEGSAQHRQDSDDLPSGTASAIGAVSQKAVAAIDGHRPFSDVVFYLGVLAHLAGDLNDPLLTAPAGEGANFAEDYPHYVERNLDRFPAVFYGYSAAPASPFDEAVAAARLSRQYFDHLSRAYAAADGKSASFDVRSIPFGVASICYSRAVTGIARVWLDVWREAHGDLTGTPHFPATAAASVPEISPPPEQAFQPRVPAPDAAATALASPPPGVIIRPIAPEPDGEVQGSESAPQGSTTITKTILGKSRKRLSKSGQDPNTQIGNPPDPNGGR